jgi:hypothetical protein
VPDYQPESPFIDDDDYIETMSDDSDEADILCEKVEKVESGDLPAWSFRNKLLIKPFEEWIQAMSQAMARMPKLKVGIFTIVANWSLESEGDDSKDFKVDIECTIEDSGSSRWVFRMGKGLKYELDTKLVQFIKDKAGGNANVELTSEEREYKWHPLDGWSKYVVV